MEADNVFLLVVEGSLFTIGGHFVDIERKKPSKLLITLGFMWWSWGRLNRCRKLLKYNVYVFCFHSGVTCSVT
jgi:hypothetical protein